MDEGGHEDGAHVGVEMGDVDARGQGPLDLRAHLDLDLLGAPARRDLLGGPGQVAVGVE